MRLVAASLLAGVLVALPARADEAERLFREGRDLVKAGKVAEACERFDASRKLTTTAGVLLNLADCNERLGRLVTAKAHWNEAIAMLEASDPRVAVARKRAAALEAKIPALILRLDGEPPAGTRVRVGALEIAGSLAARTVELDPGTHQVVLTVPGRDVVRKSVTLAEGERRTMALQVPGSEATPSPSAPDPDDDGEAIAGVGTAGWVLTAIGGAALVTWAITGGIYLADASTVDEHCDDAGNCSSQEGVDAAERGKVVGVINTVSLLAGVVLTATGITMVLAAPDDGQARVELVPSPVGMGLRVTY